MNNNKWFLEENLIIPLVANTQEEAIEKLGGLLFKNGYVKESFVPAVTSREKEFATGLPTNEVGVAIPHTDAHHVIKQAVAVGILSKPVIFAEMGDLEDKKVEVQLIFMLAVPDKNKVMTVLQQVIAIIQNKDFLKSIISTRNRADLVELLDKHLNAGVVEQVEPPLVPQEKNNIPEITVIVRHPVGLHARPAALLVKLAKQFSSNITVFCKGKEANAKSILKVLALGADQGAEVTFRAEGEDAEQALKGLRELVESNFGGVA
jgi:galactitol PTS system EIIA component